MFKFLLLARDLASKIININSGALPLSFSPSLSGCMSHVHTSTSDKNKKELLSRNQKCAAVDKGIPTSAFLCGIYPAKANNLDVDGASRACAAGSPQTMRSEEGTVSAVTTGDAGCCRSIISVVETPPRQNVRDSPLAWIMNEPM